MQETWNAIVEKYPDQWVVLKNVVFAGPDIVSAEIVCAKDDSDIFEYMDDHLDDNFTFRRTTEGVSVLCDLCVDGSRHPMTDEEVTDFVAAVRKSRHTN